ncbi:flavodoxin family protein [Rossellomorea aquimaris]|uniref:Flavodoxin family protein n=1 Tax=Rossellomorea aquimaris TaxID=189382 RepID=A0A5D4TNF4_9BACI|nr:flavodoxin family protein [Rossellomorea aquimaris]TYS75754.1 flavodoxin family protein [Rossellomorea aquimaris]
MNKIVVYSGSRSQDSRTNQIVKDITTYINREFIDVDIKNFNPVDTPLNHSTGCKNCFNHGFCPSDGRDGDYGLMLKESLEEAKLIIFATPVYSHNVSSDAKVFIDRLSYWGHILKMLGKPVITLITAESNGGNVVEDYVHKVFSIMGSTIAHSDVFYRYESDLYEEKLGDIKEAITELYHKEFKIDYTSKHEATFQTMQAILSRYPKDHFEYKYWLENGMFESDSLDEYIKANKKKFNFA